MRLGFMFGIPMWLLIVVLLGGGYWLWKRRSA